jgi:hypothetical protein
MKTQEVVIRIVLEGMPTNGKPEKAAKPPVKPYGKKVPMQVYADLVALPIGGTLDLTPTVRDLHLTLAQVKGRVYQYAYWYKKHGGEARTYSIIRGTGGTVHAIRTR